MSGRRETHPESAQGRQGRGDGDRTDEHPPCDGPPVRGTPAPRQSPTPAASRAAALPRGPTSWQVLLALPAPSAGLTRDPLLLPAQSCRVTAASGSLL